MHHNFPDLVGLFSTSGLGFFGLGLFRALASGLIEPVLYRALAYVVRAQNWARAYELGPRPVPALKALILKFLGVNIL